jgi:hypothetical protein
MKQQQKRDKDKEIRERGAGGNHREFKVLPLLAVRLSSTTRPEVRLA